MTLPIPRREFLTTSLATAAGLARRAAGGADFTLRHAPRHDPERVAIHPEIQPLVRLLEMTAPDRLIPIALDQLASGLPYRRLLAAMFLQKVRGDSSNNVWVVHSLHQTGLDMSREDHLLPFLWCYGERRRTTPGSCGR